jgi:hypothetical protein
LFFFVNTLLTTFQKKAGNYAWPCIGVFFKFE